MTKDEFIKGYCERSGVTWEWLSSPRGGNRSAEHCDCGDKKCDGWAMVRNEPLKHWQAGPVCIRGRYERPGIVLLDESGSTIEEVLTLNVEPNGQVTFADAETGYNTISMSKEDAVMVLQEAIDWIKATSQR